MKQHMMPSLSLQQLDEDKCTQMLYFLQIYGNRSSLCNQDYIITFKTRPLHE